MIEDFELLWLDFDDTWAWWLGSIAKVSVWLAVVWLVDGGLRHRSAAFRHALLLAGALGVPVVFLLNVSPIPESEGWRPREWWSQSMSSVPVANLSTDTGVANTAPGDVAPSPAPPGLRASWPRWILVTWMAGLGWSWLMLGRGWWQADRMRRRCVELPARAVPAEYQSLRILAGSSTPMTVGVVWPAILLPAVAAAWPKAMLGAILQHEAAHVRRKDVLCAALAHLALALVWWHPVAWWLQRSLARLREEACDDAVLGAGTAAGGYAEMLMRFAHQRTRRHVPFAVGAAPRSGWHRRVTRLFEVSVDRRPLARWHALTIAVTAGAAVACGTLMIGCTGPRPSAVTLTFPEKNPETLAPLPAGTTRFVVELSFFELSLAEGEWPSLPTFAAAVAGKTTVLSPEDGWQLFHPQRKGVDLLSSPRITVKSGQRAKTEVVREFIYPIEYDRDAGGPPTPVAFETQNLGATCAIELQRPARNGQPRVRLTPSLVEFDGFQPHPSMPGVLSPVFHIRRVTIDDTLENGSYIIIGTKSDVVHIEDQVPGLSAIPFAGRLFRSSRHQPIKRLAAVRVVVTPAP